MVRVQKQLEIFKECARVVWNIGFMQDSGVTTESAFKFDKIEKELFEALVLDELEIDWPEGRYRYGSVPGLIVSLKEHCSELEVDATSDTTPGQNRKWVKTKISRSEVAKLEFVSFFQWDAFSFADWPYVQCLDPTNSRLLLIEHSMCEFYLAEATTAGT
jgi:hypothetical protein